MRHESRATRRHDRESVPLNLDAFACPEPDRVPSANARFVDAAHGTDAIEKLPCRPVIPGNSHDGLYGEKFHFLEFFLPGISGFIPPYRPAAA